MITGIQASGLFVIFCAVFTLGAMADAYFEAREQRKERKPDDWT